MSTQGTRNIIRAGTTRPGYISPVEGLHAGLRFRYIPMLPEECDELDDLIKKASAKKAVALTATAIKSKLTEWSEVDEAGNAEPITAENIRRLPFDLLWSLVRIVKGMVPSDLPIDSTEEEESEFAAALKAEAEGKSPGFATLGAELKNS